MLSRAVNSHVRDHRIFNAVYINAVTPAVAYNVIGYDSSSCYSVLHVTSKPGSGINVNQVVCDRGTFSLCQLNVQPVTQVISYYVILSNCISTGVTRECHTTFVIVLDCAIHERKVLACIKIYAEFSIFFYRDTIRAEVRTGSVDSVSLCILYCTGFFKCYICALINT